MAEAGLARSQRVERGGGDGIRSRPQSQRVVDRLRRRREVTSTSRDEDDGPDRRRQLVGPVDVDGHRGGFPSVASSVLEGRVAASDERGGQARAQIYDQPRRQLIHNAGRGRRVAVDQRGTGRGAGSWRANFPLRQRARSPPPTAPRVMRATGTA